MALNSYIGSTLHVVKAEPATFNETGFEAIFASGASPAPAKVGQVQMIGDLGDTVNMIEVPVLDESRIKRIIGSRDGGTCEVTVSYDESDAGQVILEAGKYTNVVHSFKITDNTDAGGKSWYFTAILADKRWAPREMTNAMQFTQLLYPQSPVYGPYAN